MRLYINDVAVRDGFQIEKAFVPTATKIEGYIAVPPGQVFPQDSL